ncbi:GIY-YIG nuclease family protein [Amorphus orientalis]|uniref:Endonuclease n=1 Tax=Amorphus orientalis TaxID=649198 RepID=A0AAE4ARM1_9HYPH|nr:GIY-YIG nuclease family protein [Amorphus orientalis]MDQ0313995.1 putative endonuclease [Amorphus orientalis]
MAFYVYMLASRRNGTFYVGMTDDLARRIHEHQTGALPGFTRRHRIKKLVWYEVHENREAAFVRERQIKKWRREWKIALVLQENGEWRDLYETLQL